ncbi:hypothetical protein SH1V18_29840 [Vallitalea longa]|uniref:Uncharacterized protein n=1 Tax=Vallitalea longa TaxID=2936439 RepID=A0A9W5YEJ7_9FIRM|nr:hypothetical protein [Vallitalea longa]GKX30504.1 hypothetical protein SH1V18_29840 [Vallitalea longa]
MNIIYGSYEDLIKRISIIRLRLESYKKEKDLLLKVINNKREGNLVFKDEKISCKSYLKDMRIIDSHILLHEEELTRLQKEKENIDTIMSQLQGNREKIFYHRVIQGMTQEQTAEEVYLSVRQVQRLEKTIHL